MQCLSKVCFPAGAAREVAAAQSRLAEKESLHYSRSQTAAQSTAEGTPSSWKEAAQAAQQVAGAVRAAESAQAAQQQAEHTLRVTQLEVARLKVCCLHNSIGCINRPFTLYVRLLIPA